MVVKVRDGQVANKPVYVVIGVTVDGERDILGLWAGDGGECAKFWLGVFTEIKNRGVQDVCIAFCEGLKGLPEAITTTWELATVQACVIHLIRDTFRLTSRKYWEEMSRDLRPVYTAPSEAVARERFAEFDAKRGKQYPAISKLWENAWSDFIPFLDYDVEIRRVICLTNAIEFLNARYRRAVRAREHFPNDTAALKCLYLVTRALDPTGRGKAPWAMRWKPAPMRWKPALNAFAIAFEGKNQINPPSTSTVNRTLPIRRSQQRAVGDEGCASGEAPEQWVRDNDQERFHRRVGAPLDDARAGRRLGLHWMRGLAGPRRRLSGIIRV
jgi:transposase-like protein